MFSSRKYLQWNPDFSNPQFFEPPDNSNQKSLPLLSRTLLFHPLISQTLRFFEQSTLRKKIINTLFAGLGRSVLGKTVPSVLILFFKCFCLREPLTHPGNFHSLYGGNMDRLYFLELHIINLNQYVNRSTSPYFLHRLMYLCHDKIDLVHVYLEVQSGEILAVSLLV